MAPDRRDKFVTVPAAAALLLWPALWNGYPIVFADTGTYLSQAIHRYAGWDRPVFYSLFMLPLHATVTVWPVVAAQALLTAAALRFACRIVAPSLSGRAFVILAAGLAAFTSLPWLVSELMPDLFTPLTVLAIALLASGRLSRPESWVLLPLTAFMISTQQSSVPLALALGAAGAAGRFLRSRNRHGQHVTLSVMAGSGPIGVSTRWGEEECLSRPSSSALTRGSVPAPEAARILGSHARDGRCPRMAGRWPELAGKWPGTISALVSPALALLALCSVNLAAHGRFAMSPYGNIFLLARVIYDGPGLDALRRDCPASGWRLCPYRDQLPPTSDGFLWTPDSPLNRAGGPKVVSAEASAIIAAGIRAEPAKQALAAANNMIEQLRRFESGDGLTPWPAQVTPWIERDFPAEEAARYAAARQQRGALQIPEWLVAANRAVSLAGVAACLMLLPVAIRRRSVSAGMLAIVLLALPVGAAITGALSGPHDRYQARIMWLPAFAAALSLISLRTTARA
jgi:hypothetical protein